MKLTLKSGLSTLYSRNLQKVQRQYLPANKHEIMAIPDASQCTELKPGYLTLYQLLNE